MTGDEDPRIGVSSEDLLTLDESTLPLSRLTSKAVRLTLSSLALLVTIALFTGYFSSVRLVVRGSGQLEPDSIVLLHSPVSGIVSDVRTASGAHIRKGQSMFQIDTTDAFERSESIRAQIDILDAELVRLAIADSIRLLAIQTQLNLIELRRIRAMAELRRLIAERSRSIDAESLITHFVAGSDVSFDVAVGNVRTAEGERKLLEAESLTAGLSAFSISQKRRERQLLGTQLSTSGHKLARSSIVAPVDGTVITDRLEFLIGSAVEAGDPLAEIVNSSRWVVRAKISANDVGDINTGARAIIQLPSIRETYFRPLDARVASVGFRPIQSGAGIQMSVPYSSTGMFEVVLLVDSAEAAKFAPRLRLGLPATVAITKRSVGVRTLLVEWIASMIPRRV